MTSARRRPFLACAPVALLALLASAAGAATTTLVASGSTWSYLDDGSNQGTGWTALAFDDSGWSSGPAQLGYGDGDEATVVGYGPNASAKYTTTYFRHSFEVSGASGFVSLDLGLLRDDGAVVYLNGTEVFRSNMPGGTILSSTFASSAIGGSDESTFYPSSVDPGLLLEGTNVLAVEVHQANLTSSDISFDLTLSATDGQPAVVRGPYLQTATPTSILVRWRTNVPTDGVVRYGSSVGDLSSQATAGTTTEHIVELSGLEPERRYFYSVGDTAGALAGGDATYSFETSPPAGTARPTRIWVIGDSGTANAGAFAVRDAYLAETGTRRQELWLMLGDNAYTDGTDAQFQAAVFDAYPTILRSTPLWPTLGNHDGHSADSGTQSGPYYDIVSLPKAGEAGGFASGTEAYYSFDYGNVHFVCLDSYDSSRQPGSDMLTWLEDDLAATDADWTIAFWHHPPYTKGSHDSDTETELIEMRQNVLPILEAYGVDLVLTGHSHSYERSFLLDGHYGVSSTLDGSMIVDGGNGDPDGDGAYEKSGLGPVSHGGAVYAVAGSSGQTSSGPLNHPVMVASLLELGSMILDLDGGVLDARFLSSTGAIDDRFRIEKGSRATGPLFVDDFESGGVCFWSGAVGAGSC